MRRATIAQVLAAIHIVLAFGPAAAQASPFSRLIVFGDSLSDVGNIHDAYSPYPGPAYYQNRFSDGPTYAETLAAALRVSPSQFSRAGGDNFAYGGAKTTGTALPYSLVVRDVDDQVTDYLNQRTNDPGTLFVVFAGANDLIDCKTEMCTPVNPLKTDLDRLIADGAHNFFVFNLPPLGYTPRFNGDIDTRDTYNGRSQQFNTALALMLDTLEVGNPSINITRFDVAGLFAEALADPQSFGLTDVEHSAAPGLKPGLSNYSGQIAPNKSEYLFWDDLHPTATVHAILGQRAASVLAAGDYNWDGVVDMADYVAMRKAADVPYSAARYRIWRENFGNANSGFGGTVAAPEPAAWYLLPAVSFAIATLRGRRRLQ